MLKYRQYKILKQLKRYQNIKSKNNNYQHNINMLDNTFYKKIKYKQSTINTILKQLDDNGYIVDIFNKIPTSIHTIEITDEGNDALDNYYKDCFKSIISKMFWLVIGAILSQIIRNLI